MQSEFTGHIFFIIACFFIIKCLSSPYKTISSKGDIHEGNKLQSRSGCGWKKQREEQRGGAGGKIRAQGQRISKVIVYQEGLWMGQQGVPDWKGVRAKDKRFRLSLLR